MTLPLRRYKIALAHSTALNPYCLVNTTDSLNGCTTDSPSFGKCADPALDWARYCVLLALSMEHSLRARSKPGSPITKTHGHWLIRRLRIQKRSCLRNLRGTSVQLYVKNGGHYPLSVDR